MAKKPTGLNKKVSSIFSGIPSFGEEKESSSPEVKPEAQAAASLSGAKPAQLPRPMEPGHPIPKSELKFNLGSLFQVQPRPRLIFDIGSSNVKAVLMKPGLRSWTIQDARDSEFTVDHQGVRRAAGDDMVLALKEIAAALDPKHEASVGMVIGSANSFFKVIPAPEGPENTWREEIVWQLAETAPFSLEEAEVEWVKVPRLNLPHIKGVPLLAAAVERFELDRWMTIFRKAGLHLELIIPAPLAVESMLTRYRQPAAESMLIADFGAEHTQFYVFVKGQFVLMRDISFGTELVIRSLIGPIQIDNERVEIGFQEASTLVREYQLFAGIGQYDSAQPKRSQLAARVRPHMEKLVNEIKRSITYYQTEFHGPEVSNVFIIGGGAGLEGIDQFLSHELNASVSRVDLVKDFTWHLDPHLLKHTPSLRRTFGVVLGGAYVKSPRINFADWQDRWASVAAQIKQWSKVAMLGVMVVAGIGWSSLTVQQTLLDRELKAVQQKIDQAGPVTAKLTELETLGQQIELRQSLLAQAFGYEPYWGGILRELSHLIPRELVLDTFSAAENKGVPEIILTGHVQVSSRPSDMVVSELLHVLNESPFFSSAQLIKRTQQEEETTKTTFSVKADLA
ncbi:MAG: hypothetical protein COV74_02765 [Candidatus Omnitrophica bacterium CG11_big_fil_rev_8_21_14_0_20_45_26]|uniref:SHS2 domain-containing protein n=1 Tax=Candidatus Abzuiibacterium crystallinum TaxID=1974748 RepID=A0A2H0LTG5_9BACT|nr:MAG: hypothetical protein COV74_02765 [Candidatus Omnitrophica bacterium CG11_big_fil_rev_8_21_14_0_20_45_26]PIW65556.1 MAG: hypothetical protein COW12_01155 [Candidatus Omnitrophica bacterium CG12_big_fil_rev_8_21_14_0_65_45_16]